MCVVFLICAFRVNICFVIIFFTLTLALIFLTATYWLLAADLAGNAAIAGKMLKVSKQLGLAMRVNWHCSPSRRDGQLN